MRLLIIACATLPISAATAEPFSAPRERPQPIGLVEPDSKKHCPKPLAHWGSAPPKAEMKKLTELPPADAFHAVFRVDDNGCIDPVMVGYQYKRSR